MLLVLGLSHLELRLFRPRLPLLPGGPDGIECSDQVLLGDCIFNALKHTIHHRDVIGMLFVVSETWCTVFVHFWSPIARLFLAPALDDFVIEGFGQGFHGVPFPVGEVQVGEITVVVVVAVENEKLDLGLLVKVLVLSIFVFQFRESANLQFEVDGVLVRRLPLENMLIGATNIRSILASEDQAVVAMRQVGQYVLEHFRRSVGGTRLLRLDLKRLGAIVLGEVLCKLLVGPDDASEDFVDAIAILALGDVLPAQDQDVEDDVGQLRRAIGEALQHELAVEESVVVEALDVVGAAIGARTAIRRGARQVQVALLDVIVVIPAVDEKLRLDPVAHGVLRLRQEQQQADTVGLLGQEVVCTL